jgi:hypothetical protein
MCLNDNFRIELLITSQSYTHFPHDSLASPCLHWHPPLVCNPHTRPDSMHPHLRSPYNPRMALRPNSKACQGACPHLSLYYVIARTRLLADSHRDLSSCLRTRARLFRSRWTRRCLWMCRPRRSVGWWIWIRRGGRLRGGICGGSSLRRRL